jgi:hypothetical protein
VAQKLRKTKARLLRLERRRIPLRKGDYPTKSLIPKEN